jgi:diguanylate cyclase (GGDEF)-like protein
MLDVRSILTALLVCVLTTALALGAVMERDHPAARRAQGAAVLQALGWLALLAGGLHRGTLAEAVLAVIGTTCLSFSLALLRSAFLGWARLPDGARWPWVLAILLPLGYALSWPSYAIRSGWSNGLLAVLMLSLAWTLARPGRHGDAPGRWRWLVVASMLLQAGVTLGRGFLAVFMTGSYPSFLAPHPVNVAAALLALTTTVLTLVGLLLAHRDEAAQELRRLASVDGLTGLLNRRAWMERAGAALARAQRQGRTVSVLMLDLDHFKALNDAHGHARGDAALSLTGEVLTGALRRGDLAGRYGGEELCVLLEDADAADAATFDARVRERLVRRAKEVLGLPLTHSTGHVTWRPGATDADAPAEALLERLLADADAALYEAKAQGRARAVGRADPSD